MLTGIRGLVVQGCRVRSWWGRGWGGRLPSQAGQKGCGLETSLSLSSDSGHSAWPILGCSHSLRASPFLCPQAWSPRPCDILRHGEWGNLSVPESTEPPKSPRSKGLLKVMPTQARHFYPILGLQSPRGSAACHRRAACGWGWGWQGLAASLRLHSSPLPPQPPTPCRPSCPHQTAA